MQDFQGEDPVAAGGEESERTELQRGQCQGGPGDGALPEGLPTQALWGPSDPASMYMYVISAEDRKSCDLEMPWR